MIFDSIAIGAFVAHLNSDPSGFPVFGIVFSYTVREKEPGVRGLERARVDLLEDIARILGPERSVGLRVDGIRHGRKSSAIPGFSPVSCN